MKRGLLTVALAAFLFAPAAHAGFLVGASAGNSNVDVSDSGFNFNESDTGFTGRVGFRFFRFLGVEAGFVDFGNPNSKLAGGDAEISIDGYDIFAVGSIPFKKRWEVFGKAGYFNWDAKATLKQVKNTQKENTDGNDFSWGVGVGVKIIGPFHIRVEHEVFKADQADLMLTSIGADLRF